MTGLVTCGEADARLSITDQAELDELGGCQSFLGSLRVYISQETDLSPLQSLQRIEGGLFLQGNGYPPAERAPLAPLTELRSVWALSIEALATEVIDFLPSLQWIAAPAAAETIPGAATVPLSSLTIARMPRLRHVLGLGDASDFVHWEVSETPELTTLRGPRPAFAVQVVRVSRAPALTSLGDEWPTQRIEELSISLSSLQDLSALSAVQDIGSLRLTNVDEVEDLQGLGSLQSVQQLRVRDTTLRRLRGLESLQEAGIIVLAGNEQLEDASALAGLESLRSLELSNGNRSLRALPEFAQVDDLQSLRLRSTALREGPSFPRVQQAELVLISDNGDLTTFDGLPGLQAVEQLAVFNNPQLMRLSLDSLTSSTLLDVYCNAQLLPASWQPLEQVDSADAQVFGNSGSDQPCAQ